MKEFFGKTPNGDSAYLYTISCGNLKAVLSDFGATLVRLFVPDSQGQIADVVLGFDSPAEYAASGTYFGATVGRNANRIGGASIVLDNKTYSLSANDGENNLHSGPDGYSYRLWNVEKHTENAIGFSLTPPTWTRVSPETRTLRPLTRWKPTASKSPMTRFPTGTPCLT